MTRILAAVLREAGLTKQAVERRLGWSSGTLTRLFTGERRLRVQQLLAILETAGMRASQFFTLVEETAFLENSPALRAAILRGLSSAGTADSDPTALSDVGGDELDTRIKRVVRRVLASRSPDT